MKRLWLGAVVGLAAIVGACSFGQAAAPDAAATETAVERAVAATVTAAAAPPATTEVASPSPAATVASPATATPAPAPRPATPTPAATAAGAALATGTPRPTGSTVTATERPGGTRTASPLTGEEVTYLRGLGPAIRQYNQSFERFGALLREAKPEDSAWRLELQAQLELWEEGADQVRQVVAPASFAAVHRRIVVGVTLYQHAARQLNEAFQTGDRAGLSEALETARQARVAFQEAERELGQLAQERGF